jgi:hypothetical protein
VNKAFLGHFKKFDLPIKRECSEFRVTPDALLPVVNPIPQTPYLKTKTQKYNPLLPKL